MSTPTRRLPDPELRRLRRAVGLPDTGPDPDLIARWNHEEGLDDDE